MVELVDVKAGYGPVPVLHGFNVTVGAGEVAVLLGLNGAGKSTAVKVLCGAVHCSSGQVRYHGEDITGWSTSRCVQHGIVMVPEGRRVFGSLSVERNLQVGSWTQRRSRSWCEEQREHVYRVLPRLSERRGQQAGTLSGGEQQMLAIGRGLMANPQVLVIDEASLGLAPVIVKEILKIARSLADDGTTVLLVEQNVGALEIADVGFFVDQGVVSATLRGKELGDGDRIRSLYLG
ncbi:MAG TPA: ABC transporter ATP-binding protein [Acidimicrobiales bacterium]|nr:ABC transporter ATP-binding protein [Acidimicrobiales bacterium]